MWAYSLTAPGRFERVEVAVPDPHGMPPGHTLLRVAAGAICGSDLPFFHGRVYPMFVDSSPGAARVPGFPLHEVVGEVIASADPALPIGSRAVGWASRTDGLCEFVVTADDSLAEVPATPGLTDSQALTAQPLACVLDAVERIAPQPAEPVAVLGLGPFGLLFAHVLRDRGVEVVVGVDRVDRRDVAAAFGVTDLVHSSADRWAAQLDDGARPAVVIEVIGHQTGTVADAIAAVAPRGRVFCFGVPDQAVYPVPFLDLFRKGVTLGAGVVEERRTNLRRALDYLQRHPEVSDLLVTHVLPVSEVERAFALASQPAPGRLKIQLTV